MYDWQDRADFVPRGNRLQRVDREAYCDEVQVEAIRWRAKRAKLWVIDRPAKTLRKTASAAVTAGPPALVRFVASFRAASGVDSTDLYLPTKCAPKARRDSRISSFPRKMTDAQAAELY